MERNNIGRLNETMIDAMDSRDNTRAKTSGPKLVSALQAHSLFAVSLIVGIAIAIWSANYPFLWDDSLLISQSSTISNIHNIGRAFTDHYLQSINTTAAPSPYYRPLSLAVIYIEHYLFGDYPLGYRLVLQLFHLSSAALLYVVLRFMLHAACPLSRGSAPLHNNAAGMGMLLFMSFPYTIDAILLLTNLGDVMALSFLLLTVLLYLKYSLHPTFLKLTSIFCSSLLAVSSKETGIAVPFVIAFIGIALPNKISKKKTAYAIGASILASSIFLGIRSIVLSDAQQIQYFELVWRIPADFILALRWAVLPYPIALMEWAYPVKIDFIWILMLGGTILYFSLLLKLKKTQHILAIGMFLWAVCILPSLLAIQHVGFFSSRYLYVPSIGICLLVGYSYMNSSRLVRRAFFSGAFLLLLLSFIRLDVWRNEKMLWTYEASLHQDNDVTMLNLGNVLYRENKIDEALSAFHKALAISRSRKSKAKQAQALCKIAMLMEKSFHNIDKAFEYYTLAAKTNPNDIAWMGIGNIHAQYDENYEKALEAFKIAQRFKPNDPGVLSGIVAALCALHRYDEALLYLDKIEKIIMNQPEQKSDLQKRREMILSQKRIKTFP